MKKILNTAFFNRVLLICTYFVILPGYVIQGYFNTDIRIIYLLVAVINLAFIISNGKLNIQGNIAKFIFFVFAMGFLGSIISMKTSQILMATCLSTSLIIMSSEWLNFTNKQSVKIISFIISAMIIGAIGGFIYAYTGGESISKVILQGGNEVFSYGTTYTNSVSGNLIRPSAFFDEPGALAFMIILVVCINEALRGNSFKSFLLLLGGLITGSLFLFIILLVFLLYKTNLKFVFTPNFYLFILLLLLFHLFFNNAYQIADTFFFQRLGNLGLSYNGNLGDSRTMEIYNFLHSVNWDITLYGVENKTSGGQSANPFAIYYGYGIFIWIPYLFIELWLIYASLFYRSNLRLPAIILFLALLQRPYIFNLYWQMLIVLTLVIIYKLEKQPILFISGEPDAKNN